MEMAAKTAGSRAYPDQTANGHVMEFAAEERRTSQMAETTNSERTPRTGGIPLSHIIDSLDNSIPLPRDLRSFLIYCTVLAGIATGMLIHVLLSAQILQTEVELASMQDNLMVVERQNGELLWLIGRATNFQYVQDKARAEGYSPIPDRQFVQVDMSGDNIQPLSVADASQGTQLDSAIAAEQETPAPSTDGSHQNAGEPAEAPAELQQATGESEPEATGAAPDRLQVMRQWRGAILPARGAPSRPETGKQPTVADESIDEGSVPATQVSAPVETAPSPSAPDWFSELMKNVGVLFARTADH
jgi:hypothetical protein